jgi:hypothetical protein
MAEDHKSMSIASAAHTAPLIKRITGQNAITPQSVKHTTTLDLASHIEDNSIMHHAAPPMPTLSRFAATPFYDSVGFHSMHPILSYSNNSYAYTHIAADGGINYQADSFFIYAFGALTNDGSNWTTSLVHRKVLDDDFHAPAIANGLILPLSKIFVGGRNGILIVKNNPNTEEKVNVLFANKTNTIGYI